LIEGGSAMAQLLRQANGMKVAGFDQELVGPPRPLSALYDAENGYVWVRFSAPLADDYADALGWKARIAAVWPDQWLVLGFVSLSSDKTVVCFSIDDSGEEEAGDDSVVYDAETGTLTGTDPPGIPVASFEMTPTPRIIEVDVDLDTYLHLEAPGANYGSSAQVCVGRGSFTEPGAPPPDGTHTWRAILRWPLASVPAAALIERAEIKPKYDIYAHFGVTYEAYRLASPGTIVEGEATWQKRSALVDWVNQNGAMEDVVGDPVLWRPAYPDPNGPAGAGDQYYRLAEDGTVPYPVVPCDFKAMIAAAQAASETSLAVMFRRVNEVAEDGGFSAFDTTRWYHRAIAPARLRIILSVGDAEVLPSVVPVSWDTYLDDAEPNTQHDNVSLVYVRRTADPALRRGVLAFDLSAFDAAPSSVILHYFTGAVAASALSGTVQRLDATPDVDLIRNQASWNYKKSGTAWTTPGGDVTGTALTFDFPTVAGLKTIDLTTIVTEAFAAGKKVFAVLIRKTNEAADADGFAMMPDEGNDWSHLVVTP
jgi:hypothetical protein